MFKKYKVLKWTLLTIIGLIAILFTFGLWFKSLLPTYDAQSEFTQTSDLPYLTKDVVSKRGKILAVVTSSEVMGESGKPTGYELTELARAYYVFTANGYEVDIASPKGGKPPVVIDDEDMGPYDHAFLNDSLAQYKTSHTFAMNDILPEDYRAVFFTGGKGAMFDFPKNEAIQALVKQLYQSNKVIGAVCHGPSALVNVRLDNGQHLLQGKKVSGFTNKEELLLISDAESIFPFLLQDKLLAQGADFEEGTMYLEQVSHDNNIITGQNPWSTWAVAENMIEQLGHTPKAREITGEENAVRILNMFHRSGKRKAKETIAQMILQENKPVDRLLLAKHSIIGIMKGKIGDFTNILGLVSYAKDCEQERTKN